MSSSSSVVAKLCLHLGWVNWATGKEWKGTYAEPQWTDHEQSGDVDWSPRGKAGVPAESQSIWWLLRLIWTCITLWALTYPWSKGSRLWQRRTGRINNGCPVKLTGWTLRWLRHGVTPLLDYWLATYPSESWNTASAVAWHKRFSRRHANKRHMSTLEPSWYRSR